MALNDTTLKIVGELDPTKAARFSTTLITPGQTRVVTIPDADITLGAGGGDAFVANPLSQFAATTSAQLAGVISDETGTGALVFGTSPTLVTPALGTPASGNLTNCTGFPAGYVHPNHSGDVTSVADGAQTIANDAVTYAKMQNAVASSRLVGSGAAGAGANLEEITLGTNLSMAGTTLNAAAGAAGNTGTAILDFGAFPGASDASVAVTGQTGIVSGSIVQAWLRPVDTADHLADEHLVETIRIEVGNIVAGTGFTIFGIDAQLNQEAVTKPPDGPSWYFVTGSTVSVKTRQPGIMANQGGRAIRIHGQWSVSWRWS
jgi:hypothetical protein